jgi:hypothetical protein
VNGPHSLLDSHVELIKSRPCLPAAVHLAPNATRIIKALGGDLLKYGAPNVKMFKTFQPDGTPLIAVPSGTDDGENQWVSPQLDAICAGRADGQWKRLLTREFDFLALEPSGGCPERIEGARNERQ